MDVPRELLDEFAAASRKAAAHGLMRCSSGNMSLRLGDGLMLIKASRAWMSHLSADQISICRIHDNAPLNGKRPSVEIGFHSRLLRVRDDVNVVLHFQTPAATTLACMDGAPPDYRVIPEIPVYIGAVAQVPYIQPGTPALADAVVRALHDHDLAMLAHHGQVVVGRDFDDVIEKAVFFELACEIMLRGGERVAPLSAEALRVFERGRGGA